jgi:hypothetical protein
MFTILSLCSLAGIICFAMGELLIQLGSLADSWS